MGGELSAARSQGAAGSLRLATSIQTALDFIRRARREGAIQQALGALGDDVTADGIVRVAAAAGFRFTAEELARAHAHDWAMRWARHHHDAAPAADRGQG